MTICSTFYTALLLAVAAADVASDVAAVVDFRCSATELAVVSSKAALASVGMDPGLIDATFVGNVIQSRFVEPNIGTTLYTET